MLERNRLPDAIQPFNLARVCGGRLSWIDAAFRAVPTSEKVV